MWLRVASSLGLTLALATAGCGSPAAPAQTPAPLSCPEGSTMTDGHCVQTVVKEVVCPDGTHYEDGSCVANVDTDCPGGMTFEPGEGCVADVGVSDTATLMALINDRLRRTDNGEHSVNLEQSGRVVKRDAVDDYEEDFFLEDVKGIEYVHEPSWDFPHIARVLLYDGSTTRFRRGDEEWNIAPDMQVSFVFSDEEFAYEVMDALQQLVDSY